MDKPKQPKAKGSDYEVGYGKPPKHTRFPPGKSGCPKGRAKGSKNFKTLLRDELALPITITEKGVPRRMKKREALVKRIVNSSLNGDQKATELIFKIVNDLDVDSTRSAGSKGEIDQANDARLIENLRKRMAPVDQSNSDGAEDLAQEEKDDD